MRIRPQVFSAGAFALCAALAMAGCGTNSKGEAVASNSTPAAHRVHPQAVDGVTPPVQLWNQDGTPMVPTSIQSSPAADPPNTGCCAHATTYWKDSSGRDVRVIGYPTQSDDVHVRFPVPPGERLSPSGKLDNVSPGDLGGGWYTDDVAVDFPAAVTILMSGLTSANAHDELSHVASEIVPLSATPYIDGFGFTKGRGYTETFSAPPGGTESTYGSGYVAVYVPEDRPPQISMHWWSVTPTHPGAHIDTLIGASDQCPLRMIASRAVVYCQQTTRTPTAVYWLLNHQVIAVTAWNMSEAEVARLIGGPDASASG